ncbi:MAG: UPF0164 family protein, partial [Candidatus Firestonebacteria bacterium]|nr:UPF0164 family protein [Candidatus Firestonebacteria bacterium]
MFTDIPAGARPAGMGGAFSAVAEDANVMFWNPAGLVRVQRRELLAAHTQYFQNFRQEYLAFCLPWSEQQSLGFNAFFSYSDPSEKLSAAGESAGTFTAYDLYAGAAYSYALNRRYALGATLKGIGQIIDAYRAWTLAADFGFLASEVLPNLQMALVIKNAGAPLTFLEQRHPLNWSAAAGCAYALWNKRLLLSLDLEKPFFREMNFKLGAEGAVIEDVLFLRAGYGYFPSGRGA